MNVTVRDQLASLIRTWVPIGVGFVLTLLARKYGVIIDDTLSTSLTTGLAALAASVYYAVARLLEARWRPLGWLLGLAVTPKYDTVPGEVVKSG